MDNHFLIKDEILCLLLKDMSTKKNIIFATDDYDDLDKKISFKSNMTKNLVLDYKKYIIRPRVMRTSDEKSKRTRDKAEVFTPSWLCNYMNNQLDEEWFGRKNVFNESTNEKWTIKKNNIKFSKNNTWKDYIKLKKIEITCCEAPYLVSRYDTTTGEYINVKNRIGILDRKLRVINENAKNINEWKKWVFEAYKNTYGYEYQGDNLLIARVNMYLTFEEYLDEIWNKEPTEEDITNICKIINWNIWQMDGITYYIPRGKEKTYYEQSIFDFLNGEEEDKSDIDNEIEEPVDIKIYDWEKNKIIKFVKVKEQSIMKFDFCIGNPPYQENMKNTSDSPIYNYFMDSAYLNADKTLLITPARFLFNAGKTPKKWNEKILNDEHFKVIKFFNSSKDVFNRTDIEGGLAIHYYNNSVKYEKLGIYIKYDEMNTILKKVNSINSDNMSSVFYSAESYKFSQKFFEDFPKLLTKTVEEEGEIKPFFSKGHEKDLVSNIFLKLNDIAFFLNRPNDNFEYIRIIGRLNNERCYMWIKLEYIQVKDNFKNYKVFVPSANGSGNIGEVQNTPVIGEPVLGEPYVGHTQTFISLGNFLTNEEGNAALKYIKTKFCRMMLSYLKVTQNNKKETWKYVPIQDFTKNSDIAWSKSIKEIDKELYKKYGLIKKEIDFIEKNIKEME